VHTYTYVYCVDGWFIVIIIIIKSAGRRNRVGPGRPRSEFSHCLPSPARAGRRRATREKGGVCLCVCVLSMCRPSAGLPITATFTYKILGLVGIVSIASIESALSRSRSEAVGPVGARPRPEQRPALSAPADADAEAGMHG